MELYIIRHGLAVERESNIKDEERSLTGEGRKKTENVALRLQQLGLQFDLILTSPLVRARQTAEILKSTGLTSRLEESIYLAPQGNIYAWLSDLERLSLDIGELSQLAIVGHQPDLGNWAEILLWGEVGDKIVLKKAGIIGLTLPETGSPVGCSQMFWLTPPKFLL